MAVIEEYADKHQMLGCPWCGKKPHEITRPDWNSIQAGYSFLCPSVLCPVRPQTRWNASREMAKVNWNTRTMRE